MLTPIPTTPTPLYTAFENHQRIAQGTLIEIATAIKKRLGKASHGDAILFSDATGKVMEINFQGNLKTVLQRLAVFQTDTKNPETKNVETQPGPGRPKLGVVSREISLLPNQWEWLASQPGGASPVLRRLVDEARRKANTEPTPAQLQEKAYRFLSVIAGDLPLYEEALRALYQSDQKKFITAMKSWPEAISSYALALTGTLFSKK
jgi:hypothetical protein